MIDRSLDGMAFLSGQLGAVLRRRLREFGGIALISLAMMAALALATWSVQRSFAQPRHRCAGTQSARPPRRHRRRSADAIARARLAGADAADRGLGLSAARPSAAEPRALARRCSGYLAPCSRPRSLRACRAAALGRCRAGSAASSATPYCACPRYCSAFAACRQSFPARDHRWFRRHRRLCRRGRPDLARRRTRIEEEDDYEKEYEEAEEPSDEEDGEEAEADDEQAGFRSAA